MGKALAKEFSSSMLISFASSRIVELAAVMGLLYGLSACDSEMGIVRNHYVGRNIYRTR